LVEAMVTRMDTTPLSRRECRQGGPIEQLTCAQGMDRVLERLRDSASSSVSAVYPSACSDSISSRERCVIDPLFIELVNDPNVAMNRLTGELLARVSFATPNGSGLKFPLTMANAMYMATN